MHHKDHHENKTHEKMHHEAKNAAPELKVPPKSFQQYLKEYIPLIIILAVILALDFGWQSYTGQVELRTSLRLFMGLFFLLFGFFKTLDWKGFVMAYAEYDVVAKRSKTYAYLYPAIEIALGLLFLLNIYPFAVNLFTLIIMIVSSVGVIQAVVGKKKIHCACLGTVVKLPMTTVTIIEDLGMGAMAWIMLALM